MIFHIFGSELCYSINANNQVCHSYLEYLSESYSDYCRVYKELAYY